MDRPAAPTPIDADTDTHTGPRSRLPRDIWAAVAVVAVAAALRFWALSSQVGNGFYDAAVRSMSVSWHNLFFGALEPGGRVSVDKPPVDLWLQVLSTRVVGYSLLSLHLPEALAGVLAVGLLYVFLRRLAGVEAAVIGAAALAVLPISVLTARSDTMDSVLAVLILASFMAAFHALKTGSARWVLASAALVGVGFNVKLTECFVALPALALMWWWAGGPTLRSHLRGLVAAGAVFVVVGLSWATVASLTPASGRPFPVGSQTGSIWRLMLVYNGIDRVSGSMPAGTLGRGGVRGPLRLLDTAHQGNGGNIGVVLLAAGLLGALTLALTVYARREMPAPRPRLTSEARAKLALGLWLLTGVVVFSAIQRLQPRYLEVIAPPAAAVLGLGVSRLARDRRPAVTALALAITVAVVGYAALLGASRSVWIVVAVLAAAVAALALRPGRVRSSVQAPRGLLAGALAVALLAVPLGTSLVLVAHHRSDSTVVDPATSRTDEYLLAHRDGARYEVVSSNVNDVVGIVSRDALPVLILNDLHGPILRVRALRGFVMRKEVRFLFAPHGCRRRARCPPSTRWALRHSVAVPGEPGIYRFR
jgi:4-amino-4-deoxy-L-arabinose transferase-like glycosyltransferase